LLGKSIIQSLLVQTTRRIWKKNREAERTPKQTTKTAKIQKHKNYSELHRQMDMEKENWYRLTDIRRGGFSVQYSLTVAVRAKVNNFLGLRVKGSQVKTKYAKNRRRHTH